MVGDIMQPTHLLFVLVVALLVLGPKRLPEVGRQLGSGLRDFRDAISGERHDRHEVVEESYEFSDHDLAAEPTPGDHVLGEPEPVVSEAGSGEGGAGPVAHDHRPESATEPASASAPVQDTGAPGDHHFAHEPTESSGGSTQQRG